MPYLKRCSRFAPRISHPPRRVAGFLLLAVLGGCADDLPVAPSRDAPQRPTFGTSGVNEGAYTSATGMPVGPSELPVGGKLVPTPVQLRQATWYRVTATGTVTVKINPDVEAICKYTLGCPFDRELGE